jgi:HNH endonuclease
MAELSNQNLPISKDKPEVFESANRCIYCPDGKPPFTREHVVPRGMGGGMIFPNASCKKCQKIIHDVETYCMRGPFLSHRLGVGLVNNLGDLRETIKMPIIIDGKRHEKTFPVSEYPNFLVLPEFHDLPGILTGKTADNTGRISFSIWGIEEQLRALHAEGNAILVENFNLEKFGRALAKIAHGFAAGKIRLENFEPLLPEFILGKAPEKATYLLGNWGEDGMVRPSGVIHQVGMGFSNLGDKILLEVRIRLFAAYENTPVYRVVTGVLTKPLDAVLAPLGPAVSVS